MVQKFPENLILPEGVTRIDALLPDLDGKIYLFQDSQYWTFSSSTYALDEARKSLVKLSRFFSGIDRVDAVFFDPQGNAWLIAGMRYFVCEKGREAWKPTERRFGDPFFGGRPEGHGAD